MSGDPIQRRDGTLVVPDRPIIPFIEGDGTGPDIWRASVRVFDAAVAKATAAAARSRGSKCWPARRRSTRRGTGYPTRRSQAFRTYLVGIKGPLTTPVGGGIRSLNVALRQELDLYVCLRPVRYFAGMETPVDPAGPGRHGDLPREHGRHLCRDRVPGGHARGRGVQGAVRRGVPETVQEDPVPRLGRASASSRFRARAPTGWCARRSSTPSSTSGRV